ncbi:hypothetical protein E4Q23_13530 [Candidatus Accumulibacter phosphatis]|uniref:Deacetylase sirtuin-type domain-containing protein n=1 Tax=Candidatus Accumulibacter phosphatis TaxID=327160 RepID=A0ABX1U064_9PROT|nr:anti-phage defense-associated sirtuin Dsr1 [Candidatus Accumulibacter phosphatis]NMQ28689.1 hypothetical protein [Candidatus Accumulibacter phosphatis]
MQFVKHGPHVPEQLLQAHEKGRVVFFCGAGISYPAGLPGFRGLVDEIYADLGTQRNAVEEQAYSRQQYDATLDLLERRTPGQRRAVRTALMKVLQPKLRRKGAMDNHRSLIQLARDRDNALRLVTTNFDRIFEGLIARAQPVIPAYPAPLLPIPKDSRWNGIVYLHGLLPKTPDENALNRLVLTSGDFGLAYLTERWAARFVSELFRNYVVCFVGYSINDSVPRYMMDALAADRMLGEVTPDAYAFADYDGAQAGQEDQQKIEWKAKGVTPILYEVLSGGTDHSALHRTLRAWADTYRDGVLGKERIVVEYAMTRPQASTRQDDFVGRMLWALSDESGQPARRFADFDPAPSLDWLEALSEERYRHADLDRFGVAPQPTRDDKLTFNLMCRPAPYTHASRMTLVDGSGFASHCDKVMMQLGRWLTRHLDDPALALWVARHGGQLNGHFASALDDRLSELARLERDENVEELQRILTNAPKAVPSPMMRTLWRLLLSGRAKSPGDHFDLQRWQKRLAHDGLTLSLRLDLREMLAPRIALRQPFLWGEPPAPAGRPERVRDLVDWEIVLATKHVHASLKRLAHSPAWRAALPQLLADVQGLLRDALDLMREMGDANDRRDRSFAGQPSISPHAQNRGFRGWVSLIEILRDAWLETLESDPARAHRVAADWWEQPYPAFKRLALFAATHDGVATDGEWVEWLLKDDACWLWSAETYRETMRLLVLRGAELEAQPLGRLQAGILAGPPGAVVGSDSDSSRLLLNGKVWLRLAKLAFGGCVLYGDAKTRLEALTLDHPDWQLAKNESDEFSFWMSGTGDPGDEDRRQFERLPRQRRHLVKCLRLPPSSNSWHEDDWSEICRDKLSTAACALCALAHEDTWPAKRWRDALEAWSEGKLLRRSWRYLAATLQRMPDDTLLVVGQAGTRWLKAVAKILDRDEAVFLALCHRFLAMDHEDDETTEELVTRAVNHPVGHITQALLAYCFSRQPEDGQRLPNGLAQLFDMLCDPEVAQYRHARVLLAANVIALFRVDQDWTTRCLLPLFNWQRSVIEARATWEGFLWSPRLYRPLLAALKNDFLDTALHYREFGEYGRAYADLLTYAALDFADVFSTDELRQATADLPQEGLEEAAQALVNALEGAGDQRESHWNNRIKPYWHRIWPKFLELASEHIAERLACLAIASDAAFPVALQTLHEWLMPLEYPDYVVDPLHESGLCGQHPQASLQLLDTIIADQAWAPGGLHHCLDTIAKAWPEASDDSRYQRLMAFTRRHGQQ